MYTFYIAKSDIGYYEVILTSIFLIAPILNIQIESAVLRWMLNSPSFSEHRKIFTNALLITTINSIVGITIYLFVIYLFPIKNSIIILLLGLSQIYYPIILQTIRGMNENVLYVKTGIIFSCFILIFNVTFIVGFNYKLSGIMISNLLSTIITSSYVAKKLSLLKYISISSINKKMLKQFIRFCLPLIPNSIAWWAISGFTTYLILLDMGSASNGIFAASSKFAGIIFIFQNIFNLSWTESAITNYNSSDKHQYFSKVFNSFYLLFFSSILIFIPLSKTLMFYLVSPEYFMAWQYIPLLLLSVLFKSMGSFLGVGYLCSKETKGSLQTTVIGGITAIILSLFLIPKFGLYGASISLMVSHLALLLSRMYQSRKYFVINYSKAKFLSLSLLYIFVWYLTLFDYMMLEIILVGFLFIFTFLLNKSVIYKILNQIKTIYISRSMK